MSLRYLGNISFLFLFCEENEKKVQQKHKQTYMEIHGRESTVLTSLKVNISYDRLYSSTQPELS